MHISLPNYGRMRISSKILVLFTLLLTITLSFVGYVNFYISLRTIDDITRQELLSSAQRVAQQITLIWAIYTQDEVPAKINYVIMSEKSAFKQHGYNIGTYVLDANGKQIKLSDKTLGEDFLKSGLTEQDYLSMKKNRQGIVKRRLMGDAKTIAYFLVPDNQWLYVVDVKDREFLAPAYVMRNFSIGAGAAALVLAFLLSLAGARGISSPISRLVNYMSKAEKGDLTVRAAIGNDSREIESLYKSFNKMMENIERLMSGIRKMAEQIQISGQNLKKIAGTSGSKAVELTSIFKEVAAGADMQSGSMKEIDLQTQASARAAETISHLIDEAKKSSQELVGVLGNSKSAKDVLQDKMKGITEVVTSTSAMNMKLSEDLKKINYIVEMIKNVTEQTHLLSLNATIEAARAGEYGRGFSVVAREIQKLAEESSKATEDASKIIGGVEKEINRTVQTSMLGKNAAEAGREATETLNSTLSVMYDNIERSTQLMEEIFKDTQDIAGAIEKISTAVQEVTGVADTTAEMSRVAKDISEEHKRMAEELDQASSRLAATSEDLTGLTMGFTLNAYDRD